MSVLKKAFGSSRALSVVAHDRSYRIKAGGVGSTLTAPTNFGGMTDWANQRGYSEKYGLFHSWLYSAINAVASEAAGQPVCVGQMKGKETKKKEQQEKLVIVKSKMTTTARSKTANQELEVLGDSPLRGVLENPNPIQGRWQFVYAAVTNLCLTGWSYIVYGKTKEGLELYALPTTWVTPCHEKGAFAQFKVSNPKRRAVGAEPVVLGRDNVGFMHLPNPSDPLSAMAPASAEMMAIRINDHIWTSREQFFSNGIFPSVIVTIGKEPHPEVAGGIRPRLTGSQRRQVKGAISKVMGGVANYGNPAIVDGLIEKIERLSMTQNEMGWDKSEESVKRSILSAYGVHPYILNEALNVGGYAQATNIEKRFHKRVNTYLDMLGNVVTNLVGNAEEDEESSLLVWWEKCESQDPQQRNSMLRFARQNNDISQNEFRAELGFAPDEDCNESVIDKSSIPGIVNLLGQVGQGSITPEQARAVMEGLGIPSDMAKKIAGKAKEVAAVQQATGALQEATEELRQTPEEEVEKLANLILKAAQS